MLGVKSIKITPALLRQICEVDEFKGLWTGLDQHTTSLNLLADVADHGAQFKRVLGPLQDQPLTLDILRALNASQLGKSGMSDFKTNPNQLPISAHDKVYGTLDTAEPEQVEPVLTKLCAWTNDALKDETLHPLIVTAMFSAIFLQLSPFDTGNMRTIRFLVMLLMLKSGYTYAPYISLAPIMEEHAENIYKTLKNNQDSLETGQPDWSEWFSCFFELLIAQKDVLQGRLLSKETDLKNLPALSLRIMALFKNHDRLQMKEIIKLTNGRRATIKLRLGELVEAGYLRRHGQARATWYALT